MALVLVDLGAVPTASAAPVGTSLAQGRVEPPPGQPEFGKASPVALVVILALGLATVLLIVSMTRHLKKVPASFDPQPSESQPSESQPSESQPSVEDAGEPRG